LEPEPGADLLVRLESILAREREALLAGRLDVIAELVDEKEQVIAGLATAELSTAELDPLQARISHNQALLESAMAGIRSVADRIADLRRVRAGLETYDRSGKRQQFPAHAASRLEKRA
jgi:hypothetical protein